MHPAFISLIASCGVLLILVFLFLKESRRGARFFEGGRVYLDFWILKVRHILGVRFRRWGQYMIRQVLQYLLHTFLRGTIESLALAEERLRGLLRSNRTLAKKSDVERTTKNKLEEIAIHKMEVALSEKEKRIRRQQSLEG